MARMELAVEITREVPDRMLEVPMDLVEALDRVEVLDQTLEPAVVALDLEPEVEVMDMVKVVDTVMETRERVMVMDLTKVKGLGELDLRLVNPLEAVVDWHARAVPVPNKAMDKELEEPRFHRALDQDPIKDKMLAVMEILKLELHLEVDQDQDRIMDMTVREVLNQELVEPRYHRVPDRDRTKDKMLAVRVVTNLELARDLDLTKDRVLEVAQARELDRDKQEDVRLVRAHTLERVEAKFLQVPARELIMDRMLEALGLTDRMVEAKGRKALQMEAIEDKGKVVQLVELRFQAVTPNSTKVPVRMDKTIREAMPELVDLTEPAVELEFLEVKILPQVLPPKRLDVVTVTRMVLDSASRVIATVNPSTVSSPGWWQF